MKRILIIEDDPVISRVYATKYQSAGFETSTAANGQEGLDRLDAFKPDLVHLDLTIPKVNGVEIIKHIRARPEMLSLPIIVLSNTYQNRLVKTALEAGASECISKATCTPKMMLELVEKYRAQMTATPPAVPVPEANPTPVAAETPYTTEIQKYTAFHGDIARGFLARAPQKLADIRERIAPLFRAADTTRAADLTELCRVTESFAGQAAIAGFEELAQVSYALAALLRELVENPRSLSSSSLYTIVGASDFLSVLLERAPEPSSESRAPTVALVVDDDPLSRRAVCLAMARLDIPTISVDDPRTALRLLTENRFSLVFVDVEMPGMNGFEFCRELRTMPAHESTPVVYVCKVADDGARKAAMESGGSDLIAKPFLPMELAVKALTLLR